MDLHDAQYIYRYTYKELDRHINYKIYFIQLVVWLMIFTIAKLIIFWIMFENADYLINVSMNLLSVFKGHPGLELFFVMMIYPFILNVAQFWVQDHFLKGTQFIEEQRRTSMRKSVQYKSSMYIMQNGFIDFDKNREEYRMQRGLPDKDLSN